MDISYKTGQNGNILKHKARLCAKGFTQIEGINYTDIFAPVVTRYSLRILLSSAAANDWEILLNNISRLRMKEI